MVMQVYECKQDREMRWICILALFLSSATTIALRREGLNCSLFGEPDSFDFELSLRVRLKSGRRQRRRTGMTSTDRLVVSFFKVPLSESPWTSGLPVNARLISPAGCIPARKHPRLPRQHSEHGRRSVQGTSVAEFGISLLILRIR